MPALHISPPRSIGRFQAVPKGAIRAWQADPGNRDKALAAAYVTAIKWKKPMYVIPGGSYGRALWGIEPKPDVRKYGIVLPTQGMVTILTVGPDGSIGEVDVGRGEAKADMRNPGIRAGTPVAFDHPMYGPLTGTATRRWGGVSWQIKTADGKTFIIEEKELRIVGKPSPAPRRSSADNARLVQDYLNQHKDLPVLQVLSGEETLPRVVWFSGDKTLQGNHLDVVGLPKGAGLFGYHVTSEPENWLQVLEEDYERDPKKARIVGIRAMPGDALIADVQQTMPTERFGRTLDSAILITSREFLKSGTGYRAVKNNPPASARPLREEKKIGYFTVVRNYTSVLVEETGAHKRFASPAMALKAFESLSDAGRIRAWSRAILERQERGVRGNPLRCGMTKAQVIKDVRINRRTGKKRPIMQRVAIAYAHERRCKGLRNPVSRPITNSRSKPIARSPEAIKRFWRWFGTSKMIDDQGRPLVLYHGTDADFTTFDRQGDGPSKVGFWFTDDPEFASIFGQVVMPVYVSMKTPKKLTTAQWNDIRARHGGQRKYGDSKWWSSWRDQLISQGHDGVMVPSSWEKVGKVTVRNPGFFAAFDGAQIKSATGNKGTFRSKDTAITNPGPDLELDPHTYTPGQKYHSGGAPIGVIYVDPQELRRRDAGEVSTVDAETAKSMNYSEPIRASLFRDGEMVIQDGHHRVASAKQTGRPWIRAQITLINAMGEDVRRLLKRSQELSRSPVKRDNPPMTYTNAAEAAAAYHKQYGRQAMGWAKDRASFCRAEKDRRFWDVVTLLLLDGHLQPAQAMTNPGGFHAAYQDILAQVRQVRKAAAQDGHPLTSAQAIRLLLKQRRRI